MKRIYHPYHLWEDHKHNFYNNCSGIEKEEKILKVLEMFNDPELTKINMFYIVDCWTKSCEHNLTNEAMNKIAYIGQAACCNYAGVPNTVTMEAWSMLTKPVQERSDKIAKKALNRWIKNNQNKQLCLNID